MSEPLRPQLTPGRNIFEGKLIRLRAYEPGDGETMFTHLLDSEISRRDSDISWPFSRARMAQRSEELSRASSSHDRSLAIETLEGKLIGGLSIERTDPRFGTFSIGVGIAERAEWGKGYAKEAMLLALRYVFHELRYQKCNLACYDFNTRAIGLYERLGFVHEGRQRRDYYSGGEYHDLILMGLTREEFDANHPEWRIAVRNDITNAPDPR